MDLLIAEPLEPAVLDWLETRHEVFYAPRLTQDRHLFADTVVQARAVLLPPTLPIDAMLLAAAPRLRAIGRIVGGHENIDLAACARAGVEVVRNLDATAPAEAEFVLGALLALLRPSPEEAGHVAGRELGACCVGLIGMTPAARQLARILQAFGSRVVGYDPALHASDPKWTQWGVQPLGLPELFESSDALCVLLPYYSRYQGLLGERTLGQGKRGQIMVSLSPLEVFDSTVLVESLRSGRLGAAWLDQAGLGSGALEAGQPLRELQRLLVTPRLASFTRESRLRSAWGVARRIDEVLRTHPTTARHGSRRTTSASGRGTHSGLHSSTSGQPVSASLMAAGVLPDSQPGRLHAAAR